MQCGSLSCLILRSNQDHVVYRSFDGVVLEAEEGKNIARLLGQKKVLVLLWYPRNPSDICSRCDRLPSYRWDLIFHLLSMVAGKFT